MITVNNTNLPNKGLKLSVQTHGDCVAWFNGTEIIRTTDMNKFWNCVEKYMNDNTRKGELL